MSKEIKIGLIFSVKQQLKSNMYKAKHVWFVIVIWKHEDFRSGYFDAGCYVEVRVHATDWREIHSQLLILRMKCPRGSGGFGRRIAFPVFRARHHTFV